MTEAQALVKRFPSSQVLQLVPRQIGAHLEHSFCPLNHHTSTQAIMVE